MICPITYFSRVNWTPALSTSVCCRSWAIFAEAASAASWLIILVVYWFISVSAVCTVSAASTTAPSFFSLNSSASSISFLNSTSSFWMKAWRFRMSWSRSIRIFTTALDSSYSARDWNPPPSLEDRACAVGDLMRSASFWILSTLAARRACCSALVAAVGPGSACSTLIIWRSSLMRAMSSSMLVSSASNGARFRAYVSLAAPKAVMAVAASVRARFFILSASPCVFFASSDAASASSKLVLASAVAVSRVV
mmetsp:Transcript_46091/g.109897  ORF Transcript_46091/g.109897 Transcript_46091/m.109897 type:complete len:252 (+) Transcript_46091:1743-2498(+)